MAVATESNAQMCVIFNTLYDGIFNNNLGKTWIVLRVNRADSVLGGLNLTNIYFAYEIMIYNTCYVWSFI